MNDPHDEQGQPTRSGDDVATFLRQTPRMLTRSRMNQIQMTHAKLAEVVHAGRKPSTRTAMSAHNAITDLVGELERLVTGVDFTGGK